MNLNKDPESWARVSPEAVCSGSKAQTANVLTMALQDIQNLSLELNLRTRERDAARAKQRK